MPIIKRYETGISRAPSAIPFVFQRSLSVASILVELWCLATGGGFVDVGEDSSELVGWREEGKGGREKKEEIRNRVYTKTDFKKNEFSNSSIPQKTVKPVFEFLEKKKHAWRFYLIVEYFYLQKYNNAKYASYKTKYKN